MLVGAIASAGSIAILNLSNNNLTASGSNLSGIQALASALRHFSLTCADGEGGFAKVTKQSSLPFQCPALAHASDSPAPMWPHPVGDARIILQALR